MEFIDEIKDHPEVIDCSNAPAVGLPATKRPRVSEPASEPFVKPAKQPKTTKPKTNHFKCTLKYGNSKPCQKTFPTAKGSFILSYQFVSFISTHLHIHSTSVCTLRFGQPPKEPQTTGEQVPQERQTQTNGNL